MISVSPTFFAGEPALLTSVIRSAYDRSIHAFQLPLTGEVELDEPRSILYGRDDQDAAFVEGRFDVTGDGFTDAIIGGIYGAETAGAVWVISNPPDGQIDIIDHAVATLEGTETMMTFGFGVGAMDLDDDGIVDVAAGAPIHEPPGLYVFAGPVVGRQTTDDATWVFTGDHEFAWTGYTSSSGDFDGDGFTDLVVGQPGHSYVANERGSVLVYRGPVAPGHYTNVDADLLVINQVDPLSNDHFGRPIHVGDLNGDGYDDLVVGAWLDTENDKWVGSVQITYGGPDFFVPPSP